jgi:hypothetical protein
MIHAFLEDASFKSLGCGETYKNMGVPSFYPSPQAMRFFRSHPESGNKIRLIL